MASDRIVFDDVSKFYGEVLGVNKVSLAIPSGITSLVGPNGSGKTTLMNLMTALIQPTQGSIEILGVPHDQPQELFKHVGYCTQFDTFPKGATGYEFVYSYLRVQGEPHAKANALAREAIELVGLTEPSKRKIAGYSKGMRQRIKLAQAIAHGPSVLILDEPLNGLDPMARAEIIELFKRLAGDGKHVIISSHILHEVDLISDQVILINEGYVVAEGDIRGVRSEVVGRPARIMIRCDKPRIIAAEIFQRDVGIEASLLEDGGLLVSTRDAATFYKTFNQLVLDHDLRVEQVAPADDDVQSVYEYLIERGEAAS